MLREAVRSPIAFLGGAFAGALSLSLDEEPLRSWIESTAAQARISAPAPWHFQMVATHLSICCCPAGLWQLSVAAIKSPSAGLWQLSIAASQSPSASVI